MTEEFTGAKVAILWRGSVLTLLRDDRPDIPWPNYWDGPAAAAKGAKRPLNAFVAKHSRRPGSTCPGTRS